MILEDKQKIMENTKHFYGLYCMHAICTLEKFKEMSNFIKKKIHMKFYVYVITHDILYVMCIFQVICRDFLWPWFSRFIPMTFVIKYYS